MNDGKIGIGIVGSQFISSIHVESLGSSSSVADILAVASPSPGNAQKFAEKHKIPHHFTDYKKMLEMNEIDMIVIGAPNTLHCAITVDAANAGKHVVCEKPLCMNLAEADLMIKTCKDAQVKLMYAEELCFTPKYVRMKDLLDSGSLGSPIYVKQSEKHDGPHAPHFWDMDKAGGGVTMDLGCHAIEFFRWILGRPKIKTVYAQMGTYVHKDKTRGDDNALIILEFENDVVAMAEESWTRPGGMDDQAEIYGTEGHTHANLLQGNSILTYTNKGIDYAVEKAGNTVGWSFVMYEELWNYGFPQEFAHFIDCVKNDKQPLVTGDDGRVVLEVIFAAYESARLGKKIQLPFKSNASKPIDLWKN